MNNIMLAPWMREGLLFTRSQSYYYHDSVLVATVKSEMVLDPVSTGRFGIVLLHLLWYILLISGKPRLMRVQ